MPSLLREPLPTSVPPYTWRDFFTPGGNVFGADDRATAEHLAARFNSHDAAKKKGVLHPSVEMTAETVTSAELALQAARDAEERAHAHQNRVADHQHRLEFLRSALVSADAQESSNREALNAIEAHFAAIAENQFARPENYDMTQAPAHYRLSLWLKFYPTRRKEHLATIEAAQKALSDLLRTKL